MSRKIMDQRELVRRALSGDEEAFEYFVELHLERLYRFALVRVRMDHDLAEEVVQKTFCIACLKLGTFRGEAELFTWLCTICRRQIAAKLKTVGRSINFLDLTEEHVEVKAVMESMANIISNPEEITSRNEVARLVHAVLDNLPRKFGDCLEWKYIQGLSVHEIAEKLGVGTKAAESVLSRARAAFRDVFPSAISSTTDSWQAEN